MSRLRNINRELLGINVTTEINDIPIDIDEQEELINKFEITNYNNNKKFINILSILNLIICAIYILMIKSFQQRLMKTIFVLSLQSMLLSLLTLRYDLLVNDLPILNKLKLNININMNNRKLNFLNLIIIILINWLFYSNYNDIIEESSTRNAILLFLFESLPLVQYVITNSSIYWIRSINNDISNLRTLKYKYKSA